MNKDFTNHFRNEMNKIENEFESRRYNKSWYNMDPNFDDDDIYYDGVDIFSNRYVGKRRYAIVTYGYHENGDDCITMYFYDQCGDELMKLSDFENIEEIDDFISTIKSVLS